MLIGRFALNLRDNLNREDRLILSKLPFWPARWNRSTASATEPNAMPSTEQTTPANKLLVYTTCFSDPTTYWLTAAMLASLELNSPGRRAFDVLVYTDESGKAFLDTLAPTLANPPELIVGRRRTDRFNAAWTRYELFDIADTSGYSHILYVDPDVWVNADVNGLAQRKADFFEGETQLLAFRDSNEAYRLVGSEDGMKFYGGHIFQREGKLSAFANTPGFSTGVMFFKNTPQMQLVFREARTLAKRCLSWGIKLPGFYRCDQPYMNYLASTRKLVDVHRFNDAVYNNPGSPDVGSHMFFHFTGGIGGQNKPQKLGAFIEKLPVLPANWPALSTSLRLMLPFLAENRRNAKIAASSPPPAASEMPMSPLPNEPASPAVFVPRTKATKLLNRSIPGQMTDAELERLMQLVARVPAGGVIVEVGSLYGLSTWHISQACADGVTLFSIDPWRRAKWIIKQVEEPQSAPPFGPEAFKNFTADCGNVVMLQGYSPEIARGWRLPVDFYFEDAVHTNPALKSNIAFWTSHLKPGGIACGHDYSARHADVVAEADALAGKFRSTVEVVDTLWSVIKPKAVTT